MYDNDPNRLNRPPLGEPVDPPSPTGMVIGGVIVAATNSRSSPNNQQRQKGAGGAEHNTSDTQS